MLLVGLGRLSLRNRLPRRPPQQHLPRFPSQEAGKGNILDSIYVAFWTQSWDTHSTVPGSIHVAGARTLWGTSVISSTP